VILSNVDLLEDAEVETVKAWLNIHVEDIPIVEASYRDVPYEMLFGVAAPLAPNG
jgi:G3E family GTPase